MRNNPKPPPEKAAEYSKDSAILETNRTDITTLDEHLEFMKVDLKKWIVEKHFISHREVVMAEPATTVGGRGAKAQLQPSKGGGKYSVWTRKSHKPIKVKLVHIKSWLKRRTSTQVHAVEQVLKVACERIEKMSEPRAPAIIPAPKGVMVELDIFDHHIGKLCWHKEVGEDYDIKIARREYRRAVDYLLAQCKHLPIAKFVFPFGNDFFHVDNADNTTTKGTPQHHDGRWPKAFDAGTDLIVEATEGLRQIAPVEMVPVNGNHDMQRVYFLARILQAHFRNTADVEIQNSLDVRKITTWGQCAIGFTHGNEEKHSELPQIFSELHPEWGNKKFKEIHLGHWHQRKTIAFVPRMSVRKTQIKFLSSLTPADAWHHLKGYGALRSATAFVWDKKKGNIAEFNYHPD